MNSQVRNTLTALTLSAALALGLVITAPDAPAVTNTAPAQVSVAGGLSVQAPAVAALADPFHATATPPAKVEHVRRKPGKPSRIRHSMAMPFFSFAPRG